MPSVARLADLCTGHGCYPPRPNIQGSPTVFVNGRPVHRLTDAWAIHCCGPSCHGAVLAKGSTTVFVNGLPCGRIGDLVGVPGECGSVVMTGSTNVSAGG